MVEIMDKASRVVLSLFLATLILGFQALVPTAYSLSQNDNVLIFRKVVVVGVKDDNHPVLLNLTEIYIEFNLTELLSASLSTNTNTVCNLTRYDLSVSVKTVANITEDEASLVFAKVAVENETWSSVVYALVYHVEREQYNLTVLTTVITNPNNTSEYNVFLTVVNIQPVPEKAKPIMDAIVVANKTTLSNHYMILAKALKNYLADSESKWLWYKASKELKKLSKIVKKELDRYNGLAKGVAVVADFDAWCCLASIGGVIECLLANSYLLSICPLCSQVVTCIPACMTIFSIWWCLGCIGAGLAGCAACLLYAAACSYAAYGVLQCCF